MKTYSTNRTRTCKAVPLVQPAHVDLYLLQQRGQVGGAIIHNRVLAREAMQRVLDNFAATQGEARMGAMLYRPLPVVAIEYVDANGKRQRIEVQQSGPVPSAGIQHSIKRRWIPKQ